MSAAVILPLPPEFDAAIYLARYGEELFGRDAAELARHYARHGEPEGRVCSAVTDRAAFLRLLPASGPLLEVGPFCTPWPAPPGRRVHYLDIMPTEALRAAASALPWGDASRVPEIDYVWHGQPYRELVQERFDAVLSSHCIEHQPCLVSHLADLASVLAPGGRVFLVVPDHRYAFDHFIPESTLVDVLASYAERRPGHAPRTVIAQHLLQTHNDAVAHWRGEHGADPRAAPADQALVGRIAEALRAARRTGLPHDLHAWQFTPAGFRSLFDAMAAVGLSPFRVERLYPTLHDSGEFYAVLRIAA
jgi:SAM-dependent methyltransferase